MSNESITALKDQGMSNRAIAKQLGISEGCVRYKLRKGIQSDNKCVIPSTQSEEVTHIVTQPEYITRDTFNRLKAQLRVLNNISPNNPAIKTILDEFILLYKGE